MTDVNFTISEPDSALIKQIVERAKPVFAAHGRKIDVLEFRMDLTACHANGNPLRLADLLAANEFNFIHDVSGINRNINRETGKLVNCFSPRYSAPGARIGDE